MYSPDGRKEWYLNECGKSIYEENTREFLTRIFNSTELEEKLFEKDVSEFTDDEAIDYLKSLNSKSRQRLKVYAWYLSRYRQWYYSKQNIDNILDPFDDRTINKIIESIIPDSVLNDQIITEDYFKECADLEPDSINKFILICFYHGIKGDEFADIINLKMEDLDEENKTVKLISGRISCVDDYFIEHMKKASNAETYIKSIEGNNRNPKQLLYVNNGYIIRGTAGRGELFDNKPVAPEFINARMNRIRKNIGNQYFSAANLYKNGLINYLKKKFNENGISLKSAILEIDHSNTNKRFDKYLHDEQTEKYIEEFGSKMTARLLRMQIKDFIDKY